VLPSGLIVRRGARLLSCHSPRRAFGQSSRGLKSTLGHDGRSQPFATTAVHGGPWVWIEGAWERGEWAGEAGGHMLELYCGQMEQGDGSHEIVTANQRKGGRPRRRLNIDIAKPP